MTNNVPDNRDDGAPGFGIYVHWPFCASKCPYCDFNSHVRHTPIDQARFAAAYEREIDHMAALQPDEAVSSIFFGGGTPSLMQPETVERILCKIKSAWQVPDQIEITLEANPTSVEAGRFRAYRDVGINRVSLGVQSLDDEQLKFLGRTHTAEQACAAIAIARDIFPRMSFDLIYARPGQTKQQWQNELSAAIEMAVDHLSLYQLTIEQGTPFFELQNKGKLNVPDSEHAAQLFELTQDITQAAGLPAYEISNHAKPGHESRHNLTYWRFGTWAGIGPGAHGRLTTQKGRYATETEKYPESWLKNVEKLGHGLVDAETLSQEELADEMLLMGLRLREGLNLEHFQSVSGTELEPKRIQSLIDYDMLERISDTRLRATASGSLVLDAVIADLAG